MSKLVFICTWQSSVFLYAIALSLWYNGTLVKPYWFEPTCSQETDLHSSELPAVDSCCWLTTEVELRQGDCKVQSAEDGDQFTNAGYLPPGYTSVQAHRTSCDMCQCCLMGKKMKKCYTHQRIPVLGNAWVSPKHQFSQLWKFNNSLLQNCNHRTGNIIPSSSWQPLVPDRTVSLLLYW